MLATSGDISTAGVLPDELAPILQAYSNLAERMQQSHGRLQSEVVRLREELASTNAQLQRSKRLSALGEMAAGIAHEVRNPLAAIGLYVSMIVEDLSFAQPNVPLAADNARKIASAVRGLEAIVSDVLAFARETRVQPRLVNADALLRRVLDAHRPAIDAAAVGIVVDCDEELEIHADPELLSAALLNLVRNAVDAMAEHATPRILTLGADVDASDGGHATLVVRDTGPGLAEGDVDRIFNPFFTTRHTGTGLGLAIVHRIVDAHGGSIAASNDPRRGGAVFRITLPLNLPTAAGAA